MSNLKKASPTAQRKRRPGYEAILKLNTGGHTGCIRQMLPTPDGRSLVTGGECTLRVWDLATRQCSAMLLGQVAQRSEEIYGNGNVHRFALDASGQHVVVIKVWGDQPADRSDQGFDSEVQVFELASGHLRSAWRYPGRLSDLCFSADGQSFFLLGNRVNADGHRQAMLWIYDTSTLLNAGFGRRPAAIWSQVLPYGGALASDELSLAMCCLPAADAAEASGSGALVVALQRFRPRAARANGAPSWAAPQAERGCLVWLSVKRSGTASRGRSVQVQVTGQARMPTAIEVGALAASHDLVVVAALAARKGQPRAPRLWPCTHDGRVLPGLPLDQAATALAFNANGRQLLVGLKGKPLAAGEHSVQVNAYDVLDDQLHLRSSYFGHDDSLDALAWLNDGSAASAGGDNHNIHLWSAAHRVGQLQGLLRGVGRSIIQPGIDEQEQVRLGVVPPRWLPAGHPPRQQRFSLPEMRLINSCPGPVEEHDFETAKWLILDSGGQVIPIRYAPEADDLNLAPDLSLFIGADDEWVIWTRSGYYNASPGGDKHFGYHINRGAAQEALFFPADRFSKLFFKTEIVAAVVRHGSEARARAAGVSIPSVDVTAHLPPVIEVAPRGLKQSGDELRLRFTVQRVHGQQALKRVWALRNDAFVWGDASGRSAYTLTLRLQAGPNRVTILAETEQAKAVPLQLLLHGPAVADTAAGAAARAAAQAPSRPGKLFLLAVGVSDFAVAGTEAALGYKPLHHAHHDAIAVYNAFAASLPALRGQRSRRLQNKAFKGVQAELLVNEAATRDAILASLQRLCKAVEARHASAKGHQAERDVLFVFLSGHGVRYTGEPDLYFWNHDMRPKQMDATGLSMLRLGELITSVPAEVVLVIDACHAGMAGSNVLSGLNAEELAKRMHAVNERGMYVLNAARGEEKARESQVTGLGVFTSAMMAALQSPRYFSHELGVPNAPGKGRGQRGPALGMLGLMAAVQALVPRLSRQAGQAAQTPVCRMYGDLLPLAIYRR